MSTNHKITSELEEFIDLDAWAKEKLTEDEFKVYLENVADPDKRSWNLHIYHAWIKDQKITHTYTDPDGVDIEVVHTDIA